MRDAELAGWLRRAKGPTAHALEAAQQLPNPTWRPSLDESLRAHESAFPDDMILPFASYASTGAAWPCDDLPQQAQQAAQQAQHAQQLDGSALFAGDVNMYDGVLGMHAVSMHGAADEGSGRAWNSSHVRAHHVRLPLYPRYN